MDPAPSAADGPALLPGAVAALDPFTSSAAVANRAVLSVLREARENFSADITEADIAESLRHLGPDARDLAAHPAAVLDALNRLETAGLVTHEQHDHVVAIRDLAGRRHRWRLTELGRDTMDAVASVEASTGRSGSLQLTALRDIVSLVQTLVVQDQRSADDTKADFDRLLAAQHRFVDEAERFIDALASSPEADLNEDDAFLLRKEAIKRYLRHFIAQLDRMLPGLRRDLRALDGGVAADRIAVAVGSGDLYDGNRGEWAAATSARASALVEYYGPRGQGRIDRVYEAARAHIVGLTRTLSRLSKVTFGAGRLPDQFLAAARLLHTDHGQSPDQIVGALTGLLLPAHVLVERDQTVETQARAWPDDDPVRVPVTIRESNRNARQGRSAAVPDPTLDRARIRRRKAEQRAAAREQAAQLIARRQFRLSDIGQLSHGEFRSALLGCLSAALVTKPAGNGLRTGRTTDGSALDVVLRLPDDGAMATVVVEGHRFTAPDYLVTVTPRARMGVAGAADG
jgi:uncharacterized protein (TIGR02677 family)